MKFFISRRNLAGGYVALLLASACAALACGPSRGERFERIATSTRGAPGTFRTAGVSAVLERRCGSIDCHGAESRNMRIYSGQGLRLPLDGSVSGGGDTTLDEITANYQSMMDLEPEATNTFLASGGDPNQLLIVKKPLALERHKGGQVMRKGDDTERCLTTWLSATPLDPIDTNACTAAQVYPRE